jgi:hypothetical protein
MAKLFYDFLENPTPEKFLTLRQQLLSHPQYDPDSDDLADLTEMLEGNELGEAQARIKKMMPNWLLNARTHFLIGALAEMLGNLEEAHTERAIARLTIDSLLSTGDGTRNKPYLVMRVADEYDILEFLDKEPAQQSLVEVAGRKLDCIRCQDDSEIWFDVTDSFAWRNRNREDA